MAENFPCKDRESLLSALAACAKDCYFFERKHNLEDYATELQQFRVEESLFSENKVQYTVYELKSPAGCQKKRVLAIRGTKTARTIMQDISLVDASQILHEYLPSVFGHLDTQEGWDTIREICDVAQEAADRLKPDYITGHSLGGLMAEVVSSYSRIPGFSFNCPGPVGFVTETPFLNPDTEQYKGIQFEVHLRENDPVSNINYEWHINPAPVWHPGTSHHMDDMASDIQKDMSVSVTAGAFSLVSGPLLAINKRREENSKKRKYLKYIFRND